MTQKHKYTFAKKILSIVMLFVMMSFYSQAYAQEEPISCDELTTQEMCESQVHGLNCEWNDTVCEKVNGTEELQNTLYEPTEKQIIQLSDESVSDDWGIDTLETYGIKFLIRAKEALTWSLSIEDGGFHNAAIEKSYGKVLTIVNSFFILGLLAIAIMWMFSLLIPRKYLKKVILVYCLAVIFVNFALPVNRLFIDGTNLLQQTLLTEKDGDIKITDIVQTPDYLEAISYKKLSEDVLIDNGKDTKMDISFETESEEESVAIITNQETAATGTLVGPTGAESTFDLNMPESSLKLNGQSLSVNSGSKFITYGEQAIFRLVLVIATAIAYFILALIFILRIVILWALLILSPALLFLAIFRSTRGWFYNWLSMYGRWLLIGPITALGIALMVNIWQISGLPIHVGSDFVSQSFSEIKTSNLFFYLPGKDTPNTLSNTGEMMEYIVFLLMLYLPIFLGFYLTRQKVLISASTLVAKSLVKKSSLQRSQFIQQPPATEKTESKKSGGIMSDIKDLVSGKILKITETALPTKIKSKPDKPSQMMPSASNFLPENLKETPVHKLLELIGQKKGSKASHKSVIEKMANSETIQDSKEKEKVIAVFNEINIRAKNEDEQAIQIMREVETQKDNAVVINSPSDSKQDQVINNQTSNINVNENSNKQGQKIDDTSFQSKNKKDKNLKKDEEKTEENEKEEGQKEKEEETNEPENNLSAQK